MNIDKLKEKIIDEFYEEYEDHCDIGGHITELSNYIEENIINKILKKILKK